MPRIAREKSPHGMYHVMCRSISELQLFKEDEDKDRYLEIIKQYIYKFGFRVYAYCLMGNHCHMIIDSNGADISKIMHGINFSYAVYFNRKYKRHGHLFQDRFKSKKVDSDRYLITLSAYIHANPMDIKKYKKKPQKYKYSSLGVYLGVHKDKNEILDEKYIMSLFGKNINKARISYLQMIMGYKDEKISEEVEFVDEKTEYRSERVIHTRDFTADEIIDHVTSYTKIDQRMVYIKYNRTATITRSIVVLLMRRFCNFSYKKICKVIGNVTNSRISKLCEMGVKYIMENVKYEKILDDFICENC